MPILLLTDCRIFLKVECKCQWKDWGSGLALMSENIKWFTKKAFSFGAFEAQTKVLFTKCDQYSCLQWIFKRNLSYADIICGWKVQLACFCFRGNNIQFLNQSLSQRYSFTSAFQHCNKFSEELSLSKAISFWLTGLLVSQSLQVKLLPSDCVTRINSKKHVQIYYD